MASHILSASIVHRLLLFFAARFLKPRPLFCRWGGYACWHSLSPLTGYSLLAALAFTFALAHRSSPLSLPGCMLLPDTSIALVRSVLWVTFYEAVYIALYPSAERRPAFSATPYRHGWGWGRHIPYQTPRPAHHAQGGDTMPSGGAIVYASPYIKYAAICSR